MDPCTRHRSLRIEGAEKKQTAALGLASEAHNGQRAASAWTACGNRKNPRRLQQMCVPSLRVVGFAAPTESSGVLGTTGSMHRALAQSVLSRQLHVYRGNGAHEADGLESLLPPIHVVRCDGGRTSMEWRLPDSQQVSIRSGDRLASVPVAIPLRPKTLKIVNR